MTEFDTICERAGFGDLKAKNRRAEISTRRQGVFYKMYLDYPNYTEIGRQANRTHATVLHGIRNFENLLSTNDKLAVDTWRKLTE